MYKQTMKEVDCAIAARDDLINLFSQKNQYLQEENDKLKKALEQQGNAQQLNEKNTQLKRQGELTIEEVQDKKHAKDNPTKQLKDFRLQKLSSVVREIKEYLSKSSKNKDALEQMCKEKANKTSVDSSKTDNFELKIKKQVSSAYYELYQKLKNYSQQSQQPVKSSVKLPFEQKIGNNHQPYNLYFDVTVNQKSRKVSEIAMGNNTFETLLNAEEVFSHRDDQSSNKKISSQSASKAQTDMPTPKRDFGYPINSLEDLSSNNKSYQSFTPTSRLISNQKLVSYDNAFEQQSNFSTAFSLNNSHQPVIKPQNTQLIQTNPYLVLSSAIYQAKIDDINVPKAIAIDRYTAFRNINSNYNDSEALKLKFPTNNPMKVPQLIVKHAEVEYYHNSINNSLSVSSNETRWIKNQNKLNSYDVIVSNTISVPYHDKLYLETIKETHYSSDFSTEEMKYHYDFKFNATYQRITKFAITHYDDKYNSLVINAPDVFLPSRVFYANPGKIDNNVVQCSTPAKNNREIKSFLQFNKPVILNSDCGNSNIVLGSKKANSANVSELSYQHNNNFSEASSSSEPYGSQVKSSGRFSYKNEQDSDLNKTINEYNQLISRICFINPQESDNVNDFVRSIVSVDNLELSSSDTQKTVIDFPFIDESDLKM